MAQDSQSLRRRAAQAVLGPLLNENELEAALVAQQDLMRSDGISSIVAFIDKVGADAMLDGATCKRLYGEMYKALTGAAGELPADPWASRLAVSRAAAASSRGLPQAPSPPPARVVPAPVQVAAPVEAPVSVPAPVPSAPEPAAAPVQAAITLGAPQAVFAALVGDVRSTMQQFYGASFDELRVDLLAVFKKAKYSADSVKCFLAAWDEPSAAAWQALDKEKTLAELVHFLYRALCETLGPVDADQVLTRAVQAAEQAPEASSFAPARLL